MKRVILVGGGHAHLSVLEDLAHTPLQTETPTEVLLITPEAFQWYSGMLPGLIAGHYQAPECRVDLQPLAKESGVKLILDSVIGIDANRQCVCLPDGTPIEYDVLSLDVGSTTDTSWLSLSKQPVIPIKPLDSFIDRWNRYLDHAKTQGSCHIAVVGAGAAGIELALAARYVLGDNAREYKVSLIGTSSGLLPGHGKNVIRRIQRVLDRSNITFSPHKATATDDGLLLSSGELLPADCVLATTGGTAPDWLELSKLALDSSGFVAVDACHRSTSHKNVFAVGDVCARQDKYVARSGVHAVHAGPILAHNIRTTIVDYASKEPLRGKYTLKEYNAKKRSLYLLSCGSRYGVVSWGGLSFSGTWVWTWKNRIDTNFIKRFSRINE